MPVITDRLKPPVTVVFHGEIVVRGQEIRIPTHKRVNVLQKKLSKECPSTIGTVEFSGGVPNFKIRAVCNNVKKQTCFYAYE